MPTSRYPRKNSRHSAQADQPARHRLNCTPIDLHLILEAFMRRLCPILVVCLAALASVGFAQQPSAAGPYKVLKTVKVGGDGGYDYVYADDANRRLYIPRSGTAARITVFNLDTLQPVGEIPGVNAHGAAVDPKSNHGFGSSKPVAMWDSKTLATVKSID